MAVFIDNRQSSIRIPMTSVEKTAQAILGALACPDGELSIIILDDEQIADLNSRYLDRDGPTNVIAFPMREGDFPDVTPGLLGDVAISAQTAEKEGKAAGLTFQERFDQLLVHGILHLFGYDHEKEEKQAQIMAAKSEALMDAIAQMKGG